MHSYNLVDTIIVKGLKAKNPKANATVLVETENASNSFKCIQTKKTNATVLVGTENASNSFKCIQTKKKQMLRFLLGLKMRQIPLNQ